MATRLFVLLTLFPVTAWGQSDAELVRVIGQAIGMNSDDVSIDVAAGGSRSEEGTRWVPSYVLGFWRDGVRREDTHYAIHIDPKDEQAQYWVKVFIIGHELGHIKYWKNTVDGYRLTSGSSQAWYQLELDADLISAKAMINLGSSIQNVLNAMFWGLNMTDDAYRYGWGDKHPSGEARLAAIKEILHYSEPVTIAPPSNHRTIWGDGITRACRKLNAFYESKLDLNDHSQWTKSQREKIDRLQDACLRSIR